MAVYALWNNKGGVGKSYLTFQIASEYARRLMPLLPVRPTSCR